MTVFETQKPNFFLDVGWGSIFFFLGISIVSVLWWRFATIPLLKEKTTELSIYFLKAFVTILALAISYLNILFAYSFIESMVVWNQYYDAYISGECEVIEGYVEDFHPMPETLHDRESFKVSNIYFAYGSSDSRLYYEKCAKDGGYIKQNGIKVKIWYIITGENGTNLIMRIDILDY